MVNIYDSLKSLVNRDMISNAATTVEEKDFNVSNAISSIIPSLLGVFLKKGNTPQIKNILEEAGNLNILADVNQVSNERPTQDQQRIGDDFLQHLLGDKAVDFTDPIADKSGITKVATNRLVSMIAPIVSGFLGNKLVREKWSMDQLFTEIRKERDQFAPFIPADLIKTFGLASVLDTTTGAGAEVKKSNFGWIVWVVLAIVLILLFFWWRSCRTDDTAVYSERVAITDTIPQDDLNQQARDTSMNNRVSRDYNLPDGTTLRAYEGGVEGEMLNFLQSDEYKNASDKDLQNKWFQFDNIAFEFGSGTELKAESRAQINNIAAILKNHKNAKIKIAGFADKKGTEQANMKVSQERAKTIESMLDKAGVGSQVVKTQGYGDEYAKHSASESNEKRAEDRDIALRFVK